MSLLEDTARRDDKVRVKIAPHQGERGIVADVKNERLHVILESGEAIVVGAREVTNYSLAARRAWKVMPSRAVGRPKSLSNPKKPLVYVSIQKCGRHWESPSNVA